jgi:hypothetical protein
MMPTSSALICAVCGRHAVTVQVLPVTGQDYVRTCEPCRRMADRLRILAALGAFNPL